MEELRLDRQKIDISNFVKLWRYQFGVNVLIIFSSRLNYLKVPMQIPLEFQRFLLEKFLVVSLG
jgi:hypothetical protein